MVTTKQGATPQTIANEEERMGRVNRIKFLDGTKLKIIAMVSMVFDHVGDMFFPGVMWPRMIGLKWLFYVFYPGHLLLLYLIKRF